MICGVMLKDIVESTVITSRLGVDNLENQSGQSRGPFEAEEIQVGWTYCKKR